MNNRIKSLFAVCMFLTLGVLNSCNDDEEPVILPTLATLGANNVMQTSASSGGLISDDGGGLIIERGICWSTSQNPTIDLSTKSSDGEGGGSFTSQLTNLTAGTTYFIRAYATNSAGTAYGNEVSFETLPPDTEGIVATLEISNITATSATTGGLISDDGGAEITARGVCWDTNSNPTIELTTKSSDGNGIGSYTSQLTELITGTTYYIRAYATNSVGTSYGNEISFTTNDSIPELTTTEISSITFNSAKSGGSISHDGGDDIQSRGVVWNTFENPNISNSAFTEDGTGTGEFESNITSLEPGTLYYLRSYASNSVGIAYGNQVSFETEITLPDLTTNGATSISSTTAKVQAVINSDGGDAIIESGICYSLEPEPDFDDVKIVNESGQSSFSFTLENLELGTTYYVRSFATSNAGTAFGNEISFTTHDFPKISTIAASQVTKFSITSGGEILSDGGTTIFNSGLIWDTNPNPSVDLDTRIESNVSNGNFAETIHALSPSTTYYLRSYATNSVGTTYGEELSVTTNATDEGLVIGQEYAGGIIFYLDASGESGIVVTTEDQASVAWGCRDKFISGTSTTVGSGQSNTNSILDQCSETGAAKVCADLTFNRYEDWYLPSKDELNLIFENLYLNGIGQFNNIYRTSSEYDGNSAWTQQFSDGFQYNLWKPSVVGVRAVRSF
ncbi:hypothetical protein R9C00_16560 [Flammeovirgaceae bacterium SG7u.111]|nr:hypothetical protein [Flammeovirgaceae bacterium SG7u.132]WPO33315.1 hypothetical protein R9C00_16560 [Flammeovirgaceae bacterium SG7u.111]